MKDTLWNIEQCCREPSYFLLPRFQKYKLTFLCALQEYSCKTPTFFKVLFSHMQRKFLCYTLNMHLVAKGSLHFLNLRKILRFLCTSKSLIATKHLLALLYGIVHDRKSHDFRGMSCWA
jgi:hypothetical protein